MPVVVLTGAGVSTASGIPDFRGKGGLWRQPKAALSEAGPAGPQDRAGGGLWDTFDPMEFTIDRFHADPARFWSRRAAYITAARHLDAAPNAGHLALARAARDGRVERIVTQNVDGLHAKAGTPPERLLELHGNGHHAVCVRCGAKEPVHEVLDFVQRRPGVAPTCARCGGLLKPGVVLFGEAVPLMPEAAAAVSSARTLVVAGTSLQVYPAAGLVDVARSAGARVVLLNRDPTAYDGVAAEVRRGPVEDELARMFP